MGRKVKIVFLDAGISKVVRGILIEEDSFTYKIKTLDDSVMVVGKAALVKLTYEDEV